MLTIAYTFLIQIITNNSYDILDLVLLNDIFRKQNYVEPTLRFGRTRSAKSTWPVIWPRSACPLSHWNLDMQREEWMRLDKHDVAPGVERAAQDYQAPTTTTGSTSEAASGSISGAASGSTSGSATTKSTSGAAARTFHAESFCWTLSSKRTDNPRSIQEMKWLYGNDRLEQRS